MPKFLVVGAGAMGSQIAMVCALAGAVRVRPSPPAWRVIDSLLLARQHLARGNCGYWRIGRRPACCEPRAAPLPYRRSNTGSMTSGRSGMSTPTRMAAPSTAPPTRARPGPARVRTRAAAARQVAAQRRGYAAAVLRALARNQRGRTTAQIRRALRDSLTPLGLRLSPAALHQLATDIAAGRPVELP
jgi:hypothetical protein